MVCLGTTMSSFCPEVGIATLELLERFGCDVEYPFDQTCCGQPTSNTGCHEESAATEAPFVKNFAAFDYIVGPSGSCVHQVRFAFDAIEQTDEVRQVRGKTFELMEFLHDVLKVDAFPWAEFPHKGALHNDCQTLRGLGIASMSERRSVAISKPMELLSKVRWLGFVQLARPDECCGLRITFSVFEEGVSAKTGPTRSRTSIRAARTTSPRRTAPGCCISKAAPSASACRRASSTSRRS